MQLNVVQDTIIEEFNSVLDNVKGKLSYFRHFTQVGNKNQAVGLIKKSTEKLINLDKYKVWLDAEYKDGKVFFYGDSNSSVIKAVLSLYLRIFSGRTPKEILDSNIYFENEIKLYNYLPAGRQYDITSILQKIRSIASSFRLKSIEEAEYNFWPDRSAE